MKTSRNIKVKTASTHKNVSRSSWLKSSKRSRNVKLAASGLLVIGVALIVGMTRAAGPIVEDAPIRFSLGPQSVETSDGNVWEAGGFTANGSYVESASTIVGTSEQKLYQNQRTGITNLRVSDLPNGRYKVTLHFADTESTAKGQRVFGVYVEGEEEQDSLDIFRKSGGASKAYKYDFTTRIKDGALDIEFKPITGTPVLSALELLPRRLDKATAGNIPEPTNPQQPTTPVPTPTPEPTIPTPPVIPVPLPDGGRQVNITNAAQLAAAIDTAQPGDIINLADGRYEGKKVVGKYTGSFAVTVSGTQAKPIVLRGSRNAVIEGGGTGGRYGLYFVNANYWRVQGLTVTNATKGIVLDGGNFNVFENILITQTGQEGIHFRSHSSDNTIMNSEVSYTGVKNATYGEGIYFGSANSNWGTYTGGQPDKSDRNQALNNKISFTGAESMDIKEGTTGGIIKGNIINGSGMSGSWADSWLDVKGNNYTITDNIGTNALLDGFQIHVAIKGWGNNNYFANNVANVNGPGYGLSVQSGTTGNVWKCNNIVNGAASGNAVTNGKTPLACTP